MKLRFVLSALLVILLSAGISSKTEAAPWRGYRYGYCRPAVRIYAPPIVVGGYYGAPAYCPPPAPVYYGPRYAPRYYAPRYYGYHGCRHGYYR